MTKHPQVGVAVSHAGRESTWWTPTGATHSARTPLGVFETYWTNRRGVEVMDYSLALMDLTRYGRQEPWEDSPTGWPQDARMRREGRPIAQWSRVEAGRSDDLTDVDATGQLL
jgi:predicted dithiol-disulfide oxidoreductase (DUF899 family)